MGCSWVSFEALVDVYISPAFRYCDTDAATRNHR
jgi:hypothetical protein